MTTATDLHDLYHEVKGKYKQGHYEEVVESASNYIKAAQKEKDSQMVKKFDLLHSRAAKELYEKEIRYFLKKAEKEEKTYHYQKSIDSYKEASRQYDNLFKLGEDHLKIIKKQEMIKKKILELKEKLRKQQQELIKRQEKSHFEKVKEETKLDKITQQIEKKLFYKKESPRQEPSGKGRIYVDLTNILMEDLNERGEMRSKNILRIISQIEQAGYGPIICIADANTRHHVDDIKTYNGLLLKKYIEQASAGSKADIFLLKFAKRYDCKILSNDLFKEYRKEFGKEWIKSHRVAYMFVEGVLEISEPKDSSITAEKSRSVPKRTKGGETALAKRSPPKRRTPLSEPPMPRETPKKEVPVIFSSPSSEITPPEFEPESSEPILRDPSILSIREMFLSEDEEGEPSVLPSRGENKKKKEVAPKKEEKEEKEGSEEILEREVLEEILRNAERDLKDCGYIIVASEDPHLKKVCKGADLVGLKLIKTKNNKELFHLLPIKVSGLKGVIQVWENKVDYITTAGREIRSHSANHYFSSLGAMQEVLFRNIIHHGKFYKFFERYLKVTLQVETSSKGILLLHKGPIEYKVLTDPTLVCYRQPVFRVRPLPFAYQGDSNIHAIGCEDLSDYLQFLEEKYNTIENNPQNLNFIAMFEHTQAKFFNQVKTFSIPFGLYSLVILLGISFQSAYLLTTFINIGYGILPVYLLLVLALREKFIRKRNQITEEAATPYHLRKVEFDEYDLLEIRDNYSEEGGDQYVSQFKFECNNNSSKRTSRVHHAAKPLKLKLLNRIQKYKSTLSNCRAYKSPPQGEEGVQKKEQEEEEIYQLF